MCQLWLLTAATCLSVVFTGFGCISLVGAMAVYYKGKYWMITTNDMEYKFDLNKDIAFIVVQPEHPPTKHLHQQAYVEFRSQLAGNAVNKAMGFPIFKKGEKSENGYYYHNEGRFGTQEQAIAYCSSEWFCKTHNIGDHLGYPSLDMKCCKCKKKVEKFKVGETVVLGDPTPQGRGGNRRSMVQVNEDMEDICCRSSRL